jgi:hypothetical protein
MLRTSVKPKVRITLKITLKQSKYDLMIFFPPITSGNGKTSKITSLWSFSFLIYLFGETLPVKKTVQNEFLIFNLAFERNFAS